MYKRPGAAVKFLNNKIMALFTGMGISLSGSQQLTVRGRKSGQPRSVTVNPLDHEDQRYLVAPRGTTEWVRNLRVAGEGELRLGSNRQQFNAAEVADEDKPPILRQYLERWGAVTRREFGVGTDPSDEELRRIAPEHPVFHITS